MGDLQVAYPYAKAFLDLSISNNRLDLAMGDMEMLKKVGIENPSLVQALKSPLIHRERKLEILVAIFSKNIQKETFNFLELILQKERIEWVFTMVDEFLRLYKSYLNMVEIEITTAIPLTKKLEDAILIRLKSDFIKDFHKDFKGEMVLIKSIDPDLIGGMIIKIGDRKYDGSIRKGINDVKKSFNKISFME